jgi:hypothetical protein
VACGEGFDYPANKRGRRPRKCPGCRAGAAGAEVSADVDQVLAGARCGYCGAAFRPEDRVVEIAGRHYHDDDACAGEIRRRMVAREHA